MDGPHKPGAARVIIQRSADLADQARQVGFGNKEIRPQLLLQLRLGQCPWPRLYEQLQQVERLWGHMHFGPSAQELTRAGIERQVSET